MQKIIVPLLILSLLNLALIRGILWDVNFPEKYQIENFKALSQPDEITCGPTSAAMVLNFYNISTTIDEVKSVTKTQWFIFKHYRIGMTSPDFMSHALRHYRLNAVHSSLNLKKLKYLVSQNKPVICLVRSGTQTWHYVVVVGYDKDTVVVADPSGGHEWSMSNEAFLGAWNFTTDMFGEPMSRECTLCKGTGYVNPNIGPLGICVVCNGSGRKFDYIRSTILSTDIYPNTAIYVK